MKQSVPQGGVLSPMLFNIYMNKLPLPPEYVTITEYTGDVTLTSSLAQVEKLRDIITAYLNNLHDWLEPTKLKLSAEKSSATLITTWIKEIKGDPHLFINNLLIPVKSKFKVLAVIFDSRLIFEEKIRSTKEKLQKRNNILKKFGGSGWGCTKQTLSVTYKAIGRSVLYNGAPIWACRISKTNCNHLQRHQNIALRTITGCVEMSDINDLLNEGEMLTVKVHTEMLAVQFLATVLTMKQRLQPVFAA